MFRRIAALVVTVTACTLMTAIPAHAAGGTLSPQAYPNVSATYGRHYAPDGSYYTIFPQTYTYGNTGQMQVISNDAKLVPYLDKNRNEMIRLSLLPKEVVKFASVWYADDKGFGINDNNWNGKTPLPVNVTVTFNGTRHKVTLNNVYVGVYNPALPVPRFCDTPTCGGLK